MSPNVGGRVWIDCGLPSKVKFRRICDAAAVRPDEAAGRLLLLWIWGMERSNQGLLEGATWQTIGAFCGGDEAFWQAVEAVGWLRLEAEGVRIVNWHERFADQWQASVLTEQEMGDARAKQLSKLRLEFIPVPQSLDTPEFHEVWKRFFAYQQERSGHRVSRTHLEQVLRDLAKMNNVPRAVHCLEYTIRNNWSMVANPDDDRLTTPKGRKGFDLSKIKFEEGA